MKRNAIYGLTMIVALVLTLSPNLALASSPPQKGATLPEFSLPIPDNAANKTYLGLTGEGEFTIPQIKAEAVIIEVYSMYCPHCQREAPRVNELYQAIEQSPKYKGRLKLIGIGAGNSSFEVEVFAKKYKVSFPLFADADYSIHQSLGEVRTPYFIGVKIKKDGTHEVFYSKLGGFRNVDEFLQLMVKSSGLK